MLARARERAAAAGIANVSFEQADAQVHEFAGAPFDVLLSRFGVMFFADPVAAFANLRRAAAPEGRLAAVVWQPFARNEWVSVPHTALAIGRDLAPPPEDVPGPFGLADADRTGQILADAGWSDVRLDPADVTYDFGADPAVAAQHAREIGVLRGLLADLGDAQQARAMAALLEAMAEHVTPDGVRFDSQIWVVSAVR
jgi:SAM-dependent methyltransferase